MIKYDVKFYLIIRPHFNLHTLLINSRYNKKRMGKSAQDEEIPRKRILRINDL